MKLLAMHSLVTVTWLCLELCADHTNGSHQDFSKRKHENEVWVSHTIFRKHMRLLRRLSWLPACFQASTAASKATWLHHCPLGGTTAPLRHWQPRLHKKHGPVRALLEEWGPLGEQVNEDIRPTGMWKIVWTCNGHHCLKRHIFSRQLSKTARLLRLGIAPTCTFKSLEWVLLKTRLRKFLVLCIKILGHIYFIKE